MIKPCVICKIHFDEKKLYHGEICAECLVDEGHDHDEECDIEQWLLEQQEADEAEAEKYEDGN
jgi:reverse gyrase